MGRWEERQGETVTEEWWVVAPDGSLLGSGRVKVGKMIGFAETLAITDDDHGRVYVAWPAGTEPVLYRQTAHGAARVVFANPEHDFPSEITYVATSEDSLEVSATGISQGEERTESWTLQRAR